MRFPTLRHARVLVAQSARFYSSRIKDSDLRFSRTSAYYGADKQKINPSQPLYEPSPYDSSAFQNKRLALAVLSFAVFLLYFAYLREPNDLDLILNSEPHVLAGNLERQVLRSQIDEAKRAGRSTELLEAELAYVDVKEAAVKATYDRKTKKL